MGYEDIKEIKRKITERGLKVNVLTLENCTYVVERNKLRNVDEIDTLVDWRLKNRYFWNSLLGIMLYIEMIIR